VSHGGGLLGCVVSGAELRFGLADSQSLDAQRGIQVRASQSVIDQHDQFVIEHARLGARGDEARIAPAFDRAWQRSRPYVFLVTRTPE